MSAPGVDALPYILLPLAGPEELDLEVRNAMTDSSKPADCCRFPGPRKFAIRTSVPSAYEDAGSRFSLTLGTR